MKMIWMEDFNCPLCGLENLDPLYARSIPYPNYEGESIVDYEPKFLQLIYHECVNCGFRYMCPRPTPESYDRYYSTTLYRNLCSATQKEMDDGERQRGNRIASLIPPEAMSHLDVGCSRGYLLEVSRDASPGKVREVLGVEPNPDYTIPGIPTVTRIEDIEGAFDVVTCIHVLEHVNAPRMVAERLMELTKPGGILIVEVPAETYAGQSAGLPHPYAFTVPCIERLFEAMTFEKVDTSGKHPVFIMRKGKADA